MTIYGKSKAYLQNFITQCAESFSIQLLTSLSPSKCSHNFTNWGPNSVFFRKQKTMVWSKWNRDGDWSNKHSFYNLFQIAAWESLLYISTLQLGVIYPVGLVIYMCGIIWLELIISSAYTHRFCAVYCDGKNSKMYTAVFMMNRLSDT